MNNELYYIYRIINTADGKCYVGQTNDIESRKHSHFSLLNKGLHSNKKLQEAYNKYGKDAFRFEVLEFGLTVSEVNQREIHWIKHFESYARGYNQRSGGSPHLLEPTNRGVTWNGITYLSYSHASRATGKSGTTIKAYILKGLTRDSDVVGRGRKSKKPIQWDGKEYSSLDQCSLKTGICKSSLIRYRSLGIYSTKGVEDYKAQKKIRSKDRRAESNIYRQKRNNNR